MSLILFPVRLLSVELILCQPFAFVKRSRAWKNSTMPSMFDSESLPGSSEPLQEGAILLRGFVLAEAPALLVAFGGLCTGPKTAAGIERIRRAVTKHGYYSKAATEERQRAHAAIKAIKELRRTMTSPERH
jgi:hypothetical protein